MNRPLLRHGCLVALYGLALMSFTLLVAHVTIDDWEYERLRAHLDGVPTERVVDDYLARRSIPLALAAIGLLAGAAVGFRAVQSTAHADDERRTALEDPLTRLPNRRAFDQRLCELAARPARCAGPASLLFIDLDGFKELNDRHGHAIGDRALIGVAVTLRNCLDRGADVCCRWGGDEFAVLLPGTDASGALCMAERVVTALAGVRVATAHGKVLRVSGSVGIASLEELRSSKPEELPILADRALGEAKRAGKGVARLCTSGHEWMTI